MKPEQKMGIIFTALGVAMGVLSDVVGMLYVALTVPIAVYVGTVFAMTRVEKSKPVKWAVSNSVLVFLLTWIIAWIILYNMR